MTDNSGPLLALCTVTLVFADLNGMGLNLLIQAKQDAANAKPSSVRPSTVFAAL